MLTELSNASYLPQRDDRGIVVALRKAFDTAAVLSSSAKQTVQALGRTASTYPEFPILVVLHGTRARTTAGDRQRLDSVVSALREAGATRTEGVLGADAAPLVEATRPGANERNERLEIVFVAPTAS